MAFIETLKQFTVPPYPAIIVAVVAVIFLLYVYISKAVNSKKKVENAPAKKENLDASAFSKPLRPDVPAASSGDLELVGTDEKTAAVIMAIVSDKSGIPLNRLQFKSITLMEDK